MARADWIWSSVVSPRYAPADVYRRAQIVAGLASLLLAAGVAFAALATLVYGLPAVAAVAGAAALVATGTLVALRRGVSLARASAALLGTLLATILGSAAAVEGPTSEALPWVGVMPVIATMVGGRRWGVAWAALAAIGAQVVVTITDDVVACASASRLVQVVVNLLTNAAHAMSGRPAAENLLAVGARRDGDAVVLTVRDNGVGMSADVLARVFEPFFTTKPVGVGTGLGLSVSRNLVEAMGGRIDVVSEPGVGTTVRVTLAAFAETVAPPRQVA